MWTRAPGTTTFAWLDRVADITTAGLAARLREARPTAEDTGIVASDVEIDGAYADAADPDTITVTCVAHLITTSGRRDQPCATTVTLTPEPDGTLLVSGVA